MCGCVYLIGGMVSPDKQSPFSMPKKIDVNVSTLFDLKAELYKKQTEFNKQKSSSEALRSSQYVKSTGKSFEKLKVAASKKPAEKAKQSEKIKVLEKEMLEEDKKLKEVRSKLDEKAIWYDQLKSGSRLLDEEESELFLVNFDKKETNEIDQLFRSSMASQKQSTSKAKDSSDDEADIGPTNPYANEEEWVEYTDSFGRSRKCLKQDLPKFIEQDKQLGQPVAQTSTSADPKQMMSADMEKEEERRNWEKQAASEVEQGPVHYQHVLRDEAWNHGVAYYQFSRDEETRKKQLADLEEMRKKTLEQRAKSEKLKEKRKQMLAARLAKVKERKNLQTSDDEGSNSETEEPETQTGPEVDSIPLPKDVEAANRAAKRQIHERPWDKGKKKIMTQDNWNDQQRSERKAEFAPPSFY